MPARDDADELRKTAEFVRRNQTAPRGPKSAANLVGQLLARRGWAQIKWREELDQTWCHVVGERWSAYSAPAELRGGKLFVTVANSIVMQELRYAGDGLLAALRQAMPGLRVEELRFRVGRVQRG
jgi:predicted nucleic acid-binding Zn ribbon protein